MDSYTIDTIPEPDQSCGGQFFGDSIYILFNAKIGMLEGNDTIYSQKNFNDKEEWNNRCDEKEKEIKDLYYLIIDEDDF